jgi:hypothetical protein
MPDEQGYTSKLYSFEEAYRLLYGSEKDVLKYAYAVYIHTLQLDQQVRAEEEHQPSGGEKIDGQDELEVGSVSTRV